SHRYSELLSGSERKRRSLHNVANQTGFRWRSRSVRGLRRRLLQYWRSVGRVTRSFSRNPGSEIDRMIRRSETEFADGNCFARITSSNSRFMGSAQVPVEFIMPVPGFWDAGSNSKTPDLG